MAKIGFIGLGHMGYPMVRNLLTHGHTLTVFDVAPEAVSKLVKQGAKAAKSPAEIAPDNEIVFTMLQTGEQVSSTCLGDQGLFAHLNKQALYIDSSSIDISISLYLHEQARTAGIAMVDAPVSGGVAGAEAATLTIMVGGKDENFVKAKPFLEHLGKCVIHAGAEGHGQIAKICNNMILGVSMIAVAEAFNLAKKLGLDPHKLFDIASHASGECWSLTHYCPEPGIMPNVPASHDYTPGFTAKMMLKDLNLSQDAAKVANIATPLGAEATALYNLFVSSGHSETDFSGIIKMLAGKLA